MKNSKLTVKEIVIIAVTAAVIGVIYTLLDYAYMPLSAVLGQVFMEITFGVYLLSAALPMYMLRKPGAAVFGALVTAGVNLLLGSPYGIQLVLAGLLQAAGVEIGYRAGEKYKGSMLNILLGAVLGALLVFGRDCVFFGTLSLGTPVWLGILIVRLLSAVIIGTILVKYITAALVKAGVLKGFACAA